MLVAIRVANNQQVCAKDEANSNAPFACPKCRREVLLRQVKSSTPYFAHLRPEGCTYGQSETTAHRLAKLDIYLALRRHPSATEVTLERPFGTVRADVFARINGVPVAIEMQISNLSPESISYRTQEYTRQGIHVLWLLHWTPKFDTPRYSPRPFERWLHSLYFGRVYVWKEGLTVLPFRFQEYGTIVPPRRWQTKPGRIKRSHSYLRRSKRYRVAISGKALDLVRDFHPVTRDVWRGKTSYVPEARIFLSMGGRTIVRVTSH
jgi:competence protein CoiA